MFLYYLKTVSMSGGEEADTVGEYLMLLLIKDALKDARDCWGFIC